MFKPKFAPKVPIKRENGVSETSSSLPVANESTAKEETKRSEGKEKPKIKRESDRQQNRNGRGGGRGSNWVMPSGVSFFTGNAPAQLAAKMNQSITIPVKSEPTEKKSSNLRKIARPNEAIEDDTALVGGSSSFGRDFDLPPEPDLEDSDSDKSDADEEKLQRHAETWPPVHFSSLEPLSLPFGPKTPQLRKVLANEPILAPPDDLEALDYEERTTLFLVQMPSDLR